MLARENGAASRMEWEDTVVEAEGLGVPWFLATLAPPPQQKKRRKLWDKKKPLPMKTA